MLKSVRAQARSSSTSSSSSSDVGGEPDEAAKRESALQGHLDELGAMLELEGI